MLTLQLTPEQTGFALDLINAGYVSILRNTSIQHAHDNARLSMQVIDLIRAFEEARNAATPEAKNA